MRLRKKRWDQETLAKFENIVLSNESAKYKGNWQEVFAPQDALSAALPVHLEIGTGKGKFIAEIAASHLGKVNFIGLEAKTDILLCAAKKIKERILPNVKLLAVNADEILELFAPGEIERIYLNFCDPWPKKRHAKRRLTYRAFLEKYSAILSAGGEIFFKTDNEALFEFSLNEFADFGAKIRNISLDLHRNNGFYAENIMTEYESKFKALGLKIYRAEFVL